jgi:hypothetical protein
MDDDLDEIERRMDALEAVLFGSDEATAASTPTDASAWARVERLSHTLAALEESLIPDAGAELAPGAACLAYSIADGLWLAAVVEAKVAPCTYAVRFDGSDLKRQVSHDHLRAQVCDLHAMARAEDAVVTLAAKLLPAGGALSGYVSGSGAGWGSSSSCCSWPLAVPVGPLAQKATALVAASELDASAAQLALVFGEPRRLAQHADSAAVAEVSSQAFALVRRSRRVCGMG